MKSAKPILQLTAYYIVLFAIVMSLLHFFPAFAEHAPFGGTENLSSGAEEFISGKATPVNGEPLSNAIGLCMALLVVLLLMEPEAWVYMGAQRRTGRERAFILTILLLPVAVAGIVLMLQNSQALAFSLAGVVSAVRVRPVLGGRVGVV